MVSTVLNPMTCVNCGKKLAEVKLEIAIVSIKCSKCGVVNEITTSTVKNGNSQ